MNSKPCSRALASWRRRIVRGSYGHSSPSTVMSQAKRATVGSHGTGVKLREVGDGGDVGVARHLADLAGGEAGEAGAVGDEVVEVLRPGTSFALGRAYMSTNCAK